jgi:hypothetical protein
VSDDIWTWSVLIGLSAFYNVYLFLTNRRLREDSELLASQLGSSVAENILLRDKLTQASAVSKEV